MAARRPCVQTGTCWPPGRRSCCRDRRANKERTGLRAGVPCRCPGVQTGANWARTAAAAAQGKLRNSSSPMCMPARVPKTWAQTQTDSSKRSINRSNDALLDRLIGFITRVRHRIEPCLLRVGTPTEWPNQKTQTSHAKSAFWWGARIGLNAREEAQNAARKTSAPESMSRLRRIHARLRLSPCMLAYPKSVRLHLKPCPSASASVYVRLRPNARFASTK